MIGFVQFLSLPRENFKRLYLIKPLSQSRKMSYKYPTLFEINKKKALINKNPKFDREVKLEETDLFQARSYGMDWSLDNGFVKQSDYPSREAFEEELIENDYRDDYDLDPQMEKIPIREAFNQLRVFVRMREGLCENEVEKEDERFNLEMIKIFGEDEADEIDEKTNYKVCKLSKFRFLSKDGNFYHATAVRGNNYLFFLSFN